MNLNLNYYNILGVNHNSTEKEIKKTFYKLSFEKHPDHGGNADEFSIISEAYDILCGDQKPDYDRKSKYGKDYNEIEELFKIDMDYNFKEAESNFDKVKNREVLDIIVKVDDTFDGTLEFPRYVLCKTCKGTGKDNSTKIAFKNDKGEVRFFEADEGCNFCEGTGKYRDQECTYCKGQGQVGIHECKSCLGERRILGKQKLTGIKLDGDETKVESMGHLSYYDRGKVGNLIIKLR